MLFLLLSFLAGVLTILAPCVLPVLPVIIGGSLSTTKGEKYRPYVIAASLAASIIGFTLLLKVQYLVSQPFSVRINNILWLTRDCFGPHIGRA